jgi:hypothetical protein
LIESNESNAPDIAVQVPVTRDRRAVVLGYWQASVAVATGLSVIVGVLISVT